MDEELELSEEVRELFLSGALDDLLEHVARVGSEAARDAQRQANRVRAQRRLEDPEYRARTNEYSRTWQARKVATEPEFAQKRLEASRGSREYYREYYQRNKTRYAANARRLRAEKMKDPEWVELERKKNRDRARDRRARKKAEKEAQGNND